MFSHQVCQMVYVRSSQFPYFKHNYVQRIWLQHCIRVIIEKFPNFAILCTSKTVKKHNFSDRMNELATLYLRF